MFTILNLKCSYSSDEWNSVSEEDKKAVGLVKNDDGEFWLTWDDAQKYYAQLDICYWIPEALVEPLQKVFILQQHHSKWCEADGTNAGWGKLCYTILYETHFIYSRV